MGLQEDHDVLHLTLLDPGLSDPRATDGADAVNFLEPLGHRVDDLQGREPEVLDQPLRHDLADAADEPRAEILLDADERRRLYRHVRVGSELLAVFPVHGPAAAQAHVLARLDAEQVTDDGDKIPPARDRQLHHAPRGLLIGVGDTLEDALEGRPMRGA